jgi:hypothetical protein
MPILRARLVEVVEVDGIGLWSERAPGFAVATGPVPLDVLQMASD